MRAINKLAIFGNGLLSGENLKEAKNYDYLIATDLASLKLINKGIIPDLAIGDFDSVSKKDLEFQIYPLIHLKKIIPIWNWQLIKP